MYVGGMVYSDGGVSYRGLGAVLTGIEACTSICWRGEGVGPPSPILI